MRLAQPQHGPDEVLAAQAKHPRDAHDEESLHQLAHGQLALQLRLAVDVQRRVVRAVRLPRRLALPVEHVIRADVHELAAQRPARLRDVPRAVRVDGTHLAALVLVLRQIDRRPRRAVDDGVGPHLAEHAGHGLAVGDVQRHIRRARHGAAVRDARVLRQKVAANALMPAHNQLVHDVVSKLPGDAGDQYLHGYSFISIHRQ